MSILKISLATIIVVFITSNLFSQDNNIFVKYYTYNSKTDQLEHVKSSIALNNSFYIIKYTLKNKDIKREYFQDSFLKRRYIYNNQSNIIKAEHYNLNLNVLTELFNYHEDNTLKSKSAYDENGRILFTYHYFPGNSGKLSKIEEYSPNGYLFVSKVFNENDKLIEIKYYNDFGKVTKSQTFCYDKNNNIDYSLIRDKQDKIIQKDSYFPDGAVRRSELFKNDKLYYHYEYKYNEQNSKLEATLYNVDNMKIKTFTYDPPDVISNIETFKDPVKKETKKVSKKNKRINK